MNVAVEIDIKAPDLSGVDALAQAINFDRVRRTVGTNMAQTTRENFTKLDHERPNKMGGKRTNFWAQYANRENTYWQPTAEGVKVVIHDPQSHGGTGGKSILARYYHGGPEIHPVLKKWLTIPANAEAYGRRATSFDLEFSMVGGRPALVKRSMGIESERYTMAKGGKWTYNMTTHRAQSVRVKRHSIGDVMYWLTKRVRAQDPDPTVIPSDAEFQAAADESFEQSLLRKAQL